MLDAIFCLSILLMIMSVVLSGKDRFYDACGYSFSRLVFASSFWCFFNLRPGLGAAGLHSIAVAYTASMLIFEHSPAWIYYFIAYLHVGAISALLFWVDHLFTNSIRLEIRAADSGQELTAVKTLLDSICDVVVECTADFRLTRHSPNLLSMLLRSSGLSLEGTPVMDFMPPADREAFCRNMAVADEASSRASVFRGGLRDSNGGSIAVEFFAIGFGGQDGRKRHLLGVREFTDIQPLAKLRKHCSKDHKRRVPSKWAGTSPTPPEQGDVSSCGSGSDTSQADGQEGPTAGGQGSAASGQSPQAGGQDPTGGGGEPEASSSYIETLWIAKCRTLASALTQWCVDVEGRCCCRMHASMT
mmetsp:Transcript_30486/g.94708  ORF Transcript_30486/g.94708 Transcript_30486/m.94708 type:complete len:358 (-) Transcript_30486:241-1314(-)